MAKSTKNLSFDCLPVKQGSHELYIFTAEASTLWSILKINERDEDKDEGYQRVLSPSRVRAISNYIKSKKPLPLSLLVSFDSAEISKNGKQISIPNISNAGWVIDGQHRLAGAHTSGADIMLPVVAFVGLDAKSQIEQFVTINKEAKGVPTSLYYDLLKKLPKKSASEISKEKAVDIATDLRRDEDSPFFSKIVVTSAVTKGQLSLNNFVRKIYPLLQENKGFLAAYSGIEQKQIIFNYFVGLSHVFPKEFNRYDSIFFQTLGFGALINVLPYFFSLCLKRYRTFKIDDVVTTFKEVHDFDFGAWHKMGSGVAAEAEAGEDLRTELMQAFETINPDDKGALKLF